MAEISETKILPRESYRYWPKGDDIYTGSEKNIIRFIFYKVDFTEFELTELNSFKQYINSKNPNILLPEFYSKEELIRILIGCKFNLCRSYQALLNSIAWRQTNLSNSFLTLLPFCKDLLNSGSMYIHGRDHKFRPLLIINVERLDFQNYRAESYCHLLCFLLEFTIQKLMIPGQIENWVVLTDLNRRGMSQLPLTEMKMIIKILQDNFRCRMIHNYIINAPKSISFLWRIAKNFLEEHTIKKIKFSSENFNSEMRTHFAPNQYEIKYGGTAPNATKFWPPIMPAAPFNADGESAEKYLTGPEIHSLSNEISEISSALGSVSERIIVGFSGISSGLGSVSERVSVNLPKNIVICEESFGEAECEEISMNLNRKNALENSFYRGEDCEEIKVDCGEVYLTAYSKSETAKENNLTIVQHETRLNDRMNEEEDKRKISCDKDSKKKFNFCVCNKKRCVIY